MRSGCESPDIGKIKILRDYESRFSLSCLPNFSVTSANEFLGDGVNICGGDRSGLWRDAQEGFRRA